MVLDLKRWLDQPPLPPLATHRHIPSVGQLAELHRSSRRRERGAYGTGAYIGQPPPWTVQFGRQPESREMNIGLYDEKVRETD